MRTGNKGKMRIGDREKGSSFVFCFSFSIVVFCSFASVVFLELSYFIFLIVP